MGERIATRGSADGERGPGPRMTPPIIRIRIDRASHRPRGPAAPRLRPPAKCAGSPELSAGKNAAAQLPAGPVAVGRGSFPEDGIVQMASAHPAQVGSMRRPQGDRPGRRPGPDHRAFAVHRAARGYEQGGRADKAGGPQTTGGEEVGQRHGLRSKRARPRPGEEKGYGASCTAHLAQRFLHGACRIGGADRSLPLRPWRMG